MFPATLIHFIALFILEPSTSGCFLALPVSFQAHHLAPGPRCDCRGVIHSLSPVCWHTHTALLLTSPHCPGHGSSNSPSVVPCLWHARGTCHLPCAAGFWRPSLRALATACPNSRGVWRRLVASRAPDSPAWSSRGCMAAGDAAEVLHTPRLNATSLLPHLCHPPARCCCPKGQGVTRNLATEGPGSSSKATGILLGFAAFWKVPCDQPGKAAGGAGDGCPKGKGNCPLTKTGAEKQTSPYLRLLPELGVQELVPGATLPTLCHLTPLSTQPWDWVFFFPSILFLTGIYNVPFIELKT